MPAGAGMTFYWHRTYEMDIWNVEISIDTWPSHR
jgi:hypothetical protein